MPAELIMHINSINANKSVKRLEAYRAILDVYSRGGSFTDRQIMKELGKVDPNAVRPRITELLTMGELIEFGKTKDEYSGKTVRVVKRSRPDAVQMELFG